MTEKGESNLTFPKPLGLYLKPNYSLSSESDFDKAVNPSSMNSVGYISPSEKLADIKRVAGNLQKELEEKQKDIDSLRVKSDQYVAKIEELELIVEELRKGKEAIQQEVESLKLQLIEAEKNGFVDKLTGCYNQNYWIKYKNENVSFDRDNGHLAIVIVDINDLGLMNNIFGYEAGDLLLQQTAGFLRKNFRTDDVIVRVGGDEFAVICYDKSELDDDEENMEFYERVKKFDKELYDNVKIRLITDPPTRFAFGSAVYNTVDDVDIDGTRTRAGLLMHEHKDRMKNEEYQIITTESEVEKPKIPFVYEI